MIRIFTGEDRIAAKKEIEKILGEGYEVVDGADIEVTDLPTVLMGNSLFEEKRRVLIRDLGANKAAFDKLPKYLESPHEIVIWETKLDKRSAGYKAIKDKVVIREFALPKKMNYGAVFNIFGIAKKDGARAVQELRKVEQEQEPIMFLGLLISQALKDYNARPGAKEKKILKELSRLDLQIKSATIEPWLLIEAFLVRLALL
ncbi:hypothetical protein IKE99_00130 [Candidatus Saccharibacteria bacterium]|nr:hypothetical protein [Candidatus Saccharibacteria bacterium]